jgi:hypothetical protein
MLPLLFNVVMLFNVALLFRAGMIDENGRGCSQTLFTILEMRLKPGCVSFLH